MAPDLLIERARLPGRDDETTVAVTDGTIDAVGDDHDAADRVLDAAGGLVAETELESTVYR